MQLSNISTQRNKALMNENAMKLPTKQQDDRNNFELIL